MFRLRFVRLRFLVLLSLFFPVVAFAQITSVNNQTGTPVEGAGHDYIKMLSESVNPANGSVSIRIQAPTPPGRGLSVPFSFAYDSNGTYHLTTDGMGELLWMDNWSYPAKRGWSYTLPMLSNVQTSEHLSVGGPAGRCNYDGFFVMKDATGSAHALYLAYILTIPSSRCLNAVPEIPDQVLTGGDDYYKAALTTSTAPLLVADANGTVYTFPNWRNGTHTDPSTGDPSTASASLPSKMEDRNGNFLTFTDNGIGGTFGSISAQDCVSSVAKAGGRKNGAAQGVYLSQA